MTCMDSYVGRKEKQHSVKTISVDRDDKNMIIPWVQKITIAPLKNGLSLNFTLWNIESAAKPIKKTIAAHAWVHLPF